jgi:sugar lactone lactonase YvrE
LAAVGLTPSAASAAITRPYQSSFGSFGQGDRNNPAGIAVDQSNGDVYATKTTRFGVEVAAVERFDSSGAPKNFTAGPDAGTNALTGFAQPQAVAIDNSGGPLDGDIYVLVEELGKGSRENKVEVFASSGEPLGVLNGSATQAGHVGPFTACSLAIDQSTGALFVGQQGTIYRYAPKSPSGELDDADYTVTGASGIDSGSDCAGLAISSGDVYVGDSTRDLLRKYPLASFSAEVPRLPEAEPILSGVTGVGADPETGEIYVDRGSRVTVLDPATDSPTYSFGAHAYFNESKAVAVKSAPSGPASAVYVADPSFGGHEVDVFGAPANLPVFSHPEVASFGPDASAASSFSRLDQLGFDQAGQKLYALDDGTPGIYGFDASGPPAFLGLSGFTPLGTAATGEKPGLAVDNSGLGSAGNLYLASPNTNLLYGFDSSGAALAGFPVDPATSPGAPNGSPKKLCGAAVDSAGHVWVANYTTNRILEYSAAGALLPGVIDASAQGTPCRLAFDSEDNLYADVRVSSQVWRYSAASGYASATPIDRADFVEGIAVDPSNDHLYVAHFSFSVGSWIDEYDSAGNLVEEFATDLTNVKGITVDETNGNIYVAADNKIHVLGPRVLRPDLAITPASAVTNTSATLHGTIGAQGLAVSDCHFEYVKEGAFKASGFGDLSSGGSVPCSPAAGSIPVDTNLHSVSASITGLTRNVAYRFRLIATNANGLSATADLGFETVGPPLVETTGSPVRTITTARLDSRVDPRGAAATYHFEYGEQGPCDANLCTATEVHQAGSGSEFELVSQQIEGLQPNTTYHYRVIADNANPDGPAAGEDMTLTTFASEAPLSHGHLPGPPGSDRAWELVSAPDSGGNPVGGGVATDKFSIADAGDRAVYGVAGGTPDSETGTLATTLFAERTPSGWRTKGIVPSREEAIGSEWSSPGGPSDLSEMILRNSPGTGVGKYTFWRLTPSSPAQQLEGTTESPAEGRLVAVSENASPRVLAVLPGSRDPEHPVQPNTGNVYDIRSGSPEMIGLLPDGTVPACGGRASENSQTRVAHAVSADGSFAFFLSKGNDCSGLLRLYVRDIGSETTSLISKPPVSGPECNAEFIESTPGAAFFFTQSRLVAGDAEPASCLGTAGSATGDVYRYDLADDSLDCVTCVVPGVEAGVTGSSGNASIGISADGSRVYFQSSTRLLPGAAAKGGIYRVKVASGDLAYVGFTGRAIGSVTSANLSHDGSVAVFESSSPSMNALGGQQNAGARQYYRYDDRDRSLVCVSCPADGSAPRGQVPESLGGDGRGANLGSLDAAGNVFAFATPTALVAADQNTAGAGQNPEAGRDVYEWRDGRLLLVSDGLTNWPGLGPIVTGVTPSGNDIFFLEAAQLTQDALDGYRRLYDARIDGGFEFPVPPKPCPLEVCQGTPKGAPEEAAPGTATIAGVGNVAAQKTKAKKKHQKKRHKKHAKRAQHRKANSNRGAGR